MVNGRAVIVEQAVPEGRHILVCVAGQLGHADFFPFAIPAQEMNSQHDRQRNTHQNDPAADLPLPDLLLAFPGFGGVPAARPEQLVVYVLVTPSHAFSFGECQFIIHNS